MHTPVVAAAGQDSEAMKKMERDTEEKVYQIWTVLSAFEESSAAAISDMLLHVSIGKYMDGVHMAKRFIDHVQILFQAIDLLDGMYSQIHEQGKNPFAAFTEVAQHLASTFSNERQCRT